MIVARENESEPLREAILLLVRVGAYTREIFPRGFSRSTNLMHEIYCTYYLHVFNLPKSPIIKFSISLFNNISNPHEFSST